MTEKIETISEGRRAGLIGFGTAFLIFQFVSFEIEGLQLVPYLINVWLVILAFGGLSIVFRHGKYEAKEIEDALEDELVNSNRNTAFKYGFYATIFVSALLSLITPFWEFSGQIIARAILTVGVVTPMFVFAYLDRPR